MRTANTEQENRVQTTPSSSSTKKRASSSFSHFSEPSKRVALGELTNAGSSAFQNIQNVKQQRRPVKRKYEDDDAAKLAIIESTHQDSKSGSQKCKRKSEDNKENEEPVNLESDVNLIVVHNCAFSPSIYKHLRSVEMEDKRRPLPNYMKDVQNDISVSMRETLVDWLVEVAEEYKLVSDTLYHTIAYVDRFLSAHAVNRKKLQLLGVCCMLIASKYEEISPPHVEDFCYITDNTYAKEEVVDMEKEVLKFLNFEMSTPTTKTFLRIFMGATQEKDKSDLQFEFLCNYLAELSLLDYVCLRYLPSVVAASAVFLSRFTIQPEMHPWSKALQCFTGYKPSDLKECVLAIHDLHRNKRGSSLQAIREKYMQHKFKCVATLPSPSEVPARYFEIVDE